MLDATITRMFDVYIKISFTQEFCNSKNVLYLHNLFDYDFYLFKL